MTVSPGLELRQTQSLAMTPRLQQSLRMLRMSNLELAGHVAAIVEGNPLLELRAARPPRSGPGPVSGGDGAHAIDLVATPFSMRDRLRRQVRLARASPEVAAAALHVIEELEDDGYFRTPLVEFASRYRLAPETAEAGLALVQGLEPAGIGARDIAECFRLQLAERDELDAEMAAMLDHLDRLAQGGIAALAAAAGLHPDVVAARLERLRRCVPKPGAAIADDEPVAVVVPDVLVRRSGTGWDVEVNPETLPRVLMNSMYAAHIPARDTAAKRYIAECRLEATWLVRSLAQRARTILAVASAIVSHQELFFAMGEPGLKPLTRRDLAGKLGLHESTVGRVAAGKHLACERGIFALGTFFSQPLPTRRGGGAVSAAAVQARIRALIGAEDPARPLSDDRLFRALNREGILIARRTVTKYREGMAIPSSVARRRPGATGSRAP